MSCGRPEVSCLGFFLLLIIFSPKTTMLEWESSPQPVAFTVEPCYTDLCSVIEQEPARESLAARQPDEQRHGRRARRRLRRQLGRHRLAGRYYL